MSHVNVSSIEHAFDCQSTALDTLVSSEIHVLSEPSSSHAEAVQRLRADLIARQIGHGRRSLAICSPTSGAGCSYVTANLAVGFAQAGVRTLLIDGNARHPSLHDYFIPTKERPGLYDFLSCNTLSLGDAVHPDIVPGLSMLFAGKIDHLAACRLGDGFFQTAIEACLRDFDLTLIDCPAANSFSDARRIAAVTRYALIVVDKGNSYFDDVATLANELTSDGVNIVGLYLNEPIRRRKIHNS